MEGKDKRDDTGPVELGSGEFFASAPPANATTRVLDARPPDTAERMVSTGPLSPSELDSLKTLNAARKAWIVAVLVGIAGSVAAFLLWQRGDEASARAAVLQKDKDAAEQALAAQRTTLDQTKKDLEALQRENAELAAHRKQLADDLARVQATQQQMLDKMKSEIDSGDVAVSNDNGRLRVDLIDKILFDSGEAAISPRGEQVLAKVGAVLATVDDKLIEVVGHTDDSPPTNKIKEQFPTNWELSTARATNVVRFLEEKAQVKGARLVASGHGQYAPVASNSNPKGRARNRRIEILLVPPLVAQKATAPAAAAAK